MLCVPDPEFLFTLEEFNGVLTLRVPGGQWQRGENALTAARRELRMETSLRKRDCGSDLISLFTHVEKGDHDTSVFGIVLTARPMRELAPEEPEILGLYWLKYSELMRRRTFSIMYKGKEIVVKIEKKHYHGYVKRALQEYDFVERMTGLCTTHTEAKSAP